MKLTAEQYKLFRDIVFWTLVKYKILKERDMIKGYRFKIDRSLTVCNVAFIPVTNGTYNIQITINK